eukprot:1991350-Amphidinium_carterae.2
MGPVPQCSPPCKKVWTGISKKYPVCSKAIETSRMESLKSNQNMIQELVGQAVEMPVDMPMLTFTEICKKGGSSMTIQI